MKTQITLLFSCLGLALVLAGQSLHAQPSNADGKQLTELRAKAEEGDAKAQSELGSAFLFGKLGVTKDAVEALKWFRKAAGQNLAPAQFFLGVCYRDGHGVAKDEAEGVNWLRKAADQNFDQAQFLLGNCYASGQGVTKDYVEAVKWWRKAAEQNVAPAQYELGACYLEGQGVARDYAEAVKWLHKAAQQNDDKAQLALAIR